MTSHCTYEGFHVHDDGSVEHLVCVDPPTHEMRFSIQGTDVERGEYLCCKHRRVMIDELLETETAGVVITYDELKQPEIVPDGSDITVRVSIYQDRVVRVGDWWACQVVIETNAHPSLPSPPMQVAPITTTYEEALTIARKRAAELQARVNRSK